jgi:Na+-translocating ferredoxin:NAD+ oxidoreductase RnfG subunit
MKAPMLACILACMLVALPASAEHVYLREADAAHELFAPTATATRQVLELTDPERAALGKALGWRIDGKSYPYLEVRNRNDVVGVIFLLDVIGQSEPITFAVAVTAAGTIQGVHVMIYREPHGDEIEAKRFREQFVGKSAKDALTLGKDIDAISGATISSRSETIAAKKSLGLWSILHARSTHP